MNENNYESQYKKDSIAHTLSQFKLSDKRETSHEIKLHEFTIINDSVDHSQQERDKVRNKLVNSYYLFQNNICKFHLNGRCKKGGNCKFRHLGSEEIEKEMCNKFDTNQNHTGKVELNTALQLNTEDRTSDVGAGAPTSIDINLRETPHTYPANSFTSHPRHGNSYSNNHHNYHHHNHHNNNHTDKKPLLLMIDATKTPKRLVWNMTNKQWEYKTESDTLDTSIANLPVDNKYTPKRNGWCWEGIHCTNPYCKFKHRNLPPVDSNQHSSLPSSIRGPRQHKASSNLTNNYYNKIPHYKHNAHAHGNGGNGNVEMNQEGLQ